MGSIISITEVEPILFNPPVKKTPGLDNLKGTSKEVMTILHKLFQGKKIVSIS